MEDSAQNLRSSCFTAHPSIRMGAHDGTGRNRVVGRFEKTSLGRLKPAGIFVVLIGTAEAVPFQNSIARSLIPQGLKPELEWGAFSARLKSCPDTRPTPEGFIRFLRVFRGLKAPAPSGFRSPRLKASFVLCGYSGA